MAWCARADGCASEPNRGFDQSSSELGPSLSLEAGGAQFGGEIVDYEHGLSFATVHGSGHMVPTFRPRAALQLIEHVVYGSEFAPPVPNDTALAAMSEADFDSFLDSWVDKAESATYIRTEG